MILTRVRPSVFLPGLGLVWGTFAALMGATNNWQQLAAMRFLLGFAEVCGLQQRKRSMQSRADCVPGWFRARLCVLPVVLVSKVRVGDSFCSSLHISPNRRSCVRPPRRPDHWSYGRCERSRWLAMAFCKYDCSQSVHVRPLTCNRYLKAWRPSLLQSLFSSSCPTIPQAEAVS
jgi:hypothetical protein